MQQGLKFLFEHAVDSNPRRRFIFRPTPRRLTLRSASYFDFSLTRGYGGSIGVISKSYLPSRSHGNYSASTKVELVPPLDRAIAVAPHHGQQAAADDEAVSERSPLPSVKQANIGTASTRRSAVAWALQDPPWGKKTTH
jgi:hypothetical protein